MRQVHLGRIDDRFARSVSARDLDGLGAMMRLLSASATRFAGLCSSAIGGLRQFISRVIDHIPFGTRWRNEGLKRRDVLGKHDNRNQ